MKTKFKVGQVVKFKGNWDQWKYEKVFAIGKCIRHTGNSYVRVTSNGVIPNNENIEDGSSDCGCLGDIKMGPLALNAKEKGA